ncbi:hypothetical protein TNCV_4372341 [Trichonephila clavipes]|nr:hypothetical protein TNCV_4372341 [Trichonephila clavipes]
MRGKGSSNWSDSGKSRRSTKPSGNKSESCKSNKGTAGLEDLRFKRSRAVVSTGTAERKAPVLPQGLKRGVPSSISSRTYKHIRRNTNKHPSQGPETLPGASNQRQMRRFCPPKEESRSRLKKPEGLPEEQRSTGIDSLPQNSLRRRSLSMVALDCDQADRSTLKKKKKSGCIVLFRFVADKQSGVFALPSQDFLNILDVQELTLSCVHFSNKKNKL